MVQLIAVPQPSGCSKLVEVLKKQPVLVECRVVEVSCYASWRKASVASMRNLRSSVIRVSFTAHADWGVVLLQHIGLGCGSILHAAIGMVNQRATVAVPSMRNAATASSASRVRPSTPPITRREKASKITARYTNAMRSRM